MRSVQRVFGSAVVMVLLSGATAAAQDIWTAPAQGVRQLRRQLSGVTLQVITADLDDPQVRLVRARPEDGALTAAEFSEQHDAFVTVGGAAAADASRALSALTEGGAITEGAWMLRDGRAVEGAPARVWGAVGRGPAHRLVVVTATREALSRELVLDTLRGFSVDRAVALAGDARPAVRVGGRAVVASRGEVATTSVFGLRVLPGAAWFAASPEASGVEGVAREGADVAVWFTARNTGRRAWRAGDGPTLTVESAEGIQRVSIEGDTAPGAVGRFVARVSPRAAGSLSVRARLVAPDGVALLDDPMTVELAVRAREAAPRAAATRVQAAGFSMGEGAGNGPTGVAWAVLSVFGSVIAALNRRARRDG